MKKMIIFIIVIALLGTLLFLELSAKKEKDSKELKKVKVAEVTHSIFYTPLYVADALGYFEEEGLDVEIILTSGANNVAAAVMSKDVQIGFCGSEQTLYIYNEGAKDYLINFAGMTKRDGSFLVSREPMENFDLSKLNGIVLGGRQGGMPSMTLNYTLHEQGLDQLKVDTSVDFAALSGAFIGGQGDYVTLFEDSAMIITHQP